MNIGFIILYLTGKPTDKDNYELHKSSMSILQIFTILNISDSRMKVIVVFF